MKIFIVLALALTTIITGCTLPHEWDARPSGTRQRDRSVVAQVVPANKNRYYVNLWFVGCDQTNWNVYSLINIDVPDCESLISNSINDASLRKLDDNYDYMYSLPPILVKEGEWGSESITTNNSEAVAKCLVTIGGEILAISHTKGVVGKVRVFPQTNGLVRLQGAVSSTWWGDGLFPFDGVVRIGERSIVFLEHSWENPK